MIKKFMRHQGLFINQGFHPVKNRNFVVGVKSLIMFFKNPNQLNNYK